jgi:hypothetical protein
MKIRQGFVSNSSSSSFLIWGACHPRNVKISDEMFEKLDNAMLLHGEGCYIGRSLMEINDNETGAQFKKRTEEDIEKIIGVKMKLEFVSSGEY